MDSVASTAISTCHVSLCIFIIAQRFKPISLVSWELLVKVVRLDLIDFFVVF